MFRKRLIVALIASFVGGFMVLYNKWLLLAGVSFLVLMGLKEFYDMAEEKNYRPIKPLGYLGGFLFLLLACLERIDSVGIWITIYIMIIFIIQLVQIQRNRIRYEIKDLCITVFGSLYIGGLMSYLFLLKRMYYMDFKHLPGDFLVVLPFLGAYSSDSGAFIAGSLCGRKRLFPRVSPSKSLEGMIGGLTASIVTMGAWGTIIGFPLYFSLILGPVLSVFAMAGDLCESALKREFGAKDSGSFFSAHGGVMDKIDSVLFTIPISYLMLTLFLRYLRNPTIIFEYLQKFGIL